MLKEKNEAERDQKHYIGTQCIKSLLIQERLSSKSYYQ